MRVLMVWAVVGAAACTSPEPSPIEGYWGVLELDGMHPTMQLGFDDGTFSVTGDSCRATASYSLEAEAIYFSPLTLEAGCTSIEFRQALSAFERVGAWSFDDDGYLVLSGAQVTITAMRRFPV